MSKNYPGVKKLVTEDQATCFMKTDKQYAARLIGHVEIQGLSSDRPYCGYVRHSTFRTEPRGSQKSHAYHVRGRRGIRRD
jgi:hypothetical protein